MLAPAWISVPSVSEPAPTNPVSVTWPVPVPPKVRSEVMLIGALMVTALLPFWLIWGAMVP